jgi:hypothetical protein
VGALSSLSLSIKTTVSAQLYNVLVFLSLFRVTAFAFSHIPYPLSHRLTLQSSYCLCRWHRAYQVPHSTDTIGLGKFFTPGKMRDASEQHYDSTLPLAKTQAKTMHYLELRLTKLTNLHFRLPYLSSPSSILDHAFVLCFHISSSNWQTRYQACHFGWRSSPRLYE